MNAREIRTLNDAEVDAVNGGALHLGGVVGGVAGGAGGQSVPGLAANVINHTENEGHFVVKPVNATGFRSGKGFGNRRRSRWLFGDER